MPSGASILPGISPYVSISLGPISPLARSPCSPPFAVLPSLSLSQHAAPRNPCLAHPNQSSSDSSARVIEIIGTLLGLLFCYAVGSCGNDKFQLLEECPRFSPEKLL